MPITYYFPNAISYHFSNGLWHATSEEPGWERTGEKLRDLMDAVRAELGR